ncbi:MAG: HAMP domain-containing histidine kinase [Myxococcales bacterium]|nr:HAMP domain-containing histidine kinase [Myxococcales bacterium]NNK44629.1 HAMP domain-containing histidine kinase [Myxococcales bacterium]
MVKPKEIDADQMGHVLGLLVHDLRNPAATISANVDFLQEVGLADDDSNDALQDVRLGVGELRRGLDMLAWISRWLTGHVPLEAADGDVGVFLERLERADTPVPVTVEIARDDQLYAHGAQVAVEVVELLLHNTRANLPDGRATVRVYQRGNRVVIEVQDAGEAIAPELRTAAFTLEGQQALKGRSDGRYSRFVGLFAAAVVLDGVGGTIEADGEKGAAVFRVFLPGARPTRPPSA